MLWWSVHIDLIKLTFLCFARVYGCTKHCIFFAIVFQVCILWFLSGLLKSLYSHVNMYHCYVPCFLRCFLMKFYFRPDKVFRKPCLISLMRLSVVGLRSSACMYYASSGLFVWDRILFSTVSNLCVSRGTSYITVFLFLMPFIISCPFLWTDIYCFSSVMVHPPSHRTPNDISGTVFIFGKIWICLACLLRPGS